MSCANVYVTQEVYNSIQSINPTYFSIFTAAGQVLFAYPDPNSWTPKGDGYVDLCVNRDQHKFINLYDSSTFELIYQCEIMKTFEKKFKKQSDTFYTFNTDICVVGISFASSVEAENFAKQVKFICPLKKGIFSHIKNRPLVVSNPQKITKLVSVNDDVTGALLKSEDFLRYLQERKFDVREFHSKKKKLSKEAMKLVITYMNTHEIQYDKIIQEEETRQQQLQQLKMLENEIQQDKVKRLQEMNEIQNNNQNSDDNFELAPHQLHRRMTQAEPDSTHSGKKHNGKHRKHHQTVSGTNLEELDFSNAPPPPKSAPPPPSDEELPPEVREKLRKHSDVGPKMHQIIKNGQQLLPLLGDIPDPPKVAPPPPPGEAPQGGNTPNGSDSKMNDLKRSQTVTRHKKPLLLPIDIPDPPKVAPPPPPPPNSFPPSPSEIPPPPKETPPPPKETPPPPKEVPPNITKIAQLKVIIVEPKGGEATEGDEAMKPRANSQPAINIKKIENEIGEKEAKKEKKRSKKGKKNSGNEETDKEKKKKKKKKEKKEKKNITEVPHLAGFENPVHGDAVPSSLPNETSVIPAQQLPQRHNSSSKISEITKFYNDKIKNSANSNNNNNNNTLATVARTTTSPAITTPTNSADSAKTVKTNANIEDDADDESSSESYSSENYNSDESSESSDSSEPEKDTKNIILVKDEKAVINENMEDPQKSVERFAKRKKSGSNLRRPRSEFIFSRVLPPPPKFQPPPPDEELPLEIFKMRPRRYTAEIPDSVLYPSRRASSANEDDNSNNRNKHKGQNNNNNNNSSNNNNNNNKINSNNRDSIGKLVRTVSTGSPPLEILEIIGKNTNTKAIMNSPIVSKQNERVKLKITDKERPPPPMPLSSPKMQKKQNEDESTSSDE